MICMKYMHFKTLTRLDTKITDFSNFPKRAFHRLVYLSEILPKNEQNEQILSNFFEIRLSKDLPNDRFSRDFLLDIKRVTFGEKYQFFQSKSHTVQCIFLKNEQNEQISMKSLK